MRLSGWKLPIERISHSAISCAVACPEQFRRKYVLGQREKMWEDRFVGDVDHVTWERWFADRSIDLETTYREAWTEKVDKYGDIEWTKTEPEVAYKRGVAMLKAYLPVAETLNPVAIEEWIEVQIPDVPVPLVGKIDLRETTRILDRKTDKNKVSKPKAKWRFQARLYQLVYPLPFEWHIITKQVTPQVVTPAEAPTLTMEVANPDVTVRMIQHTVARLNDYYARYGKDTAWPTDGLFGDWACDYCGFGPKFERSCLAWTY